VNLSRSRKLLLGIATAWPLFYMVIFMVVWLTLVFTIASLPASGTGTGLPTGFVVIFVLHVLTMLEMLVLVGVYAWLVVKRFVGDETQRLMWLLLVILTGFVGQLVFFCLKVWPEPVPATAEAPTAGSSGV